LEDPSGGIRSETKLITSTPVVTSPNKLTAMEESKTKPPIEEIKVYYHE